MIILLNYIKKFMMSFFTEKFGGRDILLLGIMLILIIRMTACHPKNSSVSVTPPSLAKIEQIFAKDKTAQSVIPQTVFTQSQMETTTKPIAKNLGLSSVSQVTKDVVHLDFDTTVPGEANVVDNTINTSFSNKNISVTHVYNTQTKVTNFGIHLTPDTVTYVTGIKTKWFKPNEYTVHINHTNDLFKDDMGSSYTFKEQKDWLVLGPSVGVGVGYNNNKFTIFPTVGITATVPLIRFKRKR